MSGENPTAATVSDARTGVADVTRVGFMVDPNGYEFTGLEEYVPASAVIPNGA